MVSIFSTAPIVVDLGTQTTVFYTQDERVLLQAPTLWEPDGRDIDAISPIQRGLIADDQALLALLRQWKRQLQLSWLSEVVRPQTLVIVPSSLTPMHAVALRQVFGAVGFAAPTLLPVGSALYASLGSNLKRDTTLVMDLGAAKTEIAIVGSKGVIRAKTLPQGGMDLDLFLGELIESECALRVAGRDLNTIKTQYSLAANNDKTVFVVRGKNLASNMVVSKQVSCELIEAVLRQYLDAVVATVADLFYQSEPAIVDDITHTGVYLAGGLSQLSGIDQRLSAQLQLPVALMARPKLALAMGGAKLLKQSQALTRLKVSFDE